jgi:hypothetical protein
MGRPARISEFRLDTRNANRGTARGRAAIIESLRRFGAGRSVLLDKHGRVIAGNKTVEAAAELGIEDAVIVQSDGRQLVAVQRMDIDLDTPEGRMAAIADNRSSELDLEWDAQALADAVNSGMDLGSFFRQDEVDEIIRTAATIDRIATGDVNDRNGRTNNRQRIIKILVISEHLGTIEAALMRTGLDARGDALATVCRAYLMMHEKGQHNVATEDGIAPRSHRTHK